MKINKTFRLVSIGFSIATIGVLLVNCSKSDTPTPVTPTPVTPIVVTSVQVNLATSSVVGTYLTDSSGVALYYFAKDANGKPNCTGGCASYWPYFSKQITSQAQLGDGLLLADFDTSSVGGVKITTYKGWPLYYYASDGKTKETPGTTKGEGVGKTWMVAKTNYSLLLSEASVHNYNSNNDSTKIFWVDNSGKTLYYFSKDSISTSKCTGGCVTYWPVFYQSDIVVPSYFNKSDFATITRSDGVKQTTYKTKPLYYYEFDNSTRAVVNGQGKSENTWFVANP